MRRLVSSVILTMAISVPVGADQDADVMAILDQLETAWSGINDYTMQVDKTERMVDGSYRRQRVFLKYRRPGQFYFKVLDGPGKGGELIYPKSEAEPIAVAHPGGAKGGFARFLKKTIILRRLVPTEFSLQDPRIIRGQHQTVVESSLGKTIELISENIRRAFESGEGEATLHEDCDTFDECSDRIDVRLPGDTGVEHSVAEGETLWTIASRHDRPMYVIWYNNPELKEPTDVRPGQVIFVPRYYASRGTIWVDPENGLLKRLDTFDRADLLYERYLYSEIHVNTGLGDIDFDIENPEYQF